MKLATKTSKRESSFRGFNCGNGKALQGDSSGQTLAFVDNDFHCFAWPAANATELAQHLGNKADIRKLKSEKARV